MSSTIRDAASRPVAGFVFVDIGKAADLHYAGKNIGLMILVPGVVSNGNFVPQTVEVCR